MQFTGFTILALVLERLRLFQTEFSLENPESVHKVTNAMRVMKMVGLERFSSRCWVWQWVKMVGTGLELRGSITLGHCWM